MSTLRIAKLAVRIAVRIAAGLLALVLGIGFAPQGALAGPDTPNPAPATAQELPPCGQVTKTAQGGFYVGVKHVDDNTVSVQAFQATFSSGNVYDDGWSYVEQCYSEKQANNAAIDWALFYRDSAGYARVIVGSVHDGPINLGQKPEKPATTTPSYLYGY